jgi:hypothetical protein
MATPNYELIFAKVAELLAGITTLNGYATDLKTGAVTRKFLFLHQAEAKGMWPVVCVVRKPGSAGQRISQGTRYLCTLPVWIVSYFRCDQSDDGAVPDTDLNSFQNDVQKLLTTQASRTALAAVGAFDLGFPEEPEIGIEAGDDEGEIFAAMFHTVELNYFLPRTGF